MIKFACPACQKAYQVADELAGKRIKCKACGKAVQIPQRTAPQAAGQPWARWLAECQRRFGEAPRQFDEQTTAYLSLAHGWVYGILALFFPMCKLLKTSRQRSIFRDGQVVWGHVIQANDVLWGPSQSAGPGNEESDDAPGELVFSLDVEGRVTPPQLETIAEELGSLRGDDFDDPELQKIADYLEAETVRAFGWSVPKRISPKVPCYISTTIFLRKHLPEGYLHREFLPVVISAKPPYFAMPLPERFWSPDLKEWWTEGSDADEDDDEDL